MHLGLNPQVKRRRSPDARRAGTVLAGGLCVMAAIAIWALITASFDDTSARILASALIATVATLCGLAGGTVLGHEDHRHLLGQATIVVAGIALGLALVLTWVPAAESEAVLRAFGASLAALIACVHASLICSRVSARDHRLVAALSKVAVGSVSGAALLVSCLLALASGEEVSTSVWRLLGVILVIALLATLLVPLLRKTSADGTRSQPVDTRPAKPPRRKQSPSRPRRHSLMLGRRAAG